MNQHSELIETLGLLAEPREIESEKLRLAKLMRLPKIPRNSDLLGAVPPELRARFSSRLQIKRTRSLSGIVVLGVMSSPRGCPHGRCVFCPMERGFPLSYTEGEPAAMRGRELGYDPYLQVQVRLGQLEAIGHCTSKVELIIQGGTFPAAPREYQEGFVKRCLDALNGLEAGSLEEAKAKAETARIRNVGITVETKPDWAKEKHVDLMLQLGITRVEIGVQALDDGVLQLVNRGHTVADVVEAFRICKDAALKITAHMMPGLPGSRPDADLAAFHRMFNDEDFKPDMLKIYPCLVVGGTTLHDWWREGKYSPYELETVIDLLAKVKEIVPPWVRIMRVQREIPAGKIAAGVRKGNLRELVLHRIRARGHRCRCIRCREVGFRQQRDGISLNLDEIQISRIEYEASSGVEFFVSAEDPVNDVLVGYARLRIPSELAHRGEIASEPCGLIRELHVYGPVVAVGSHEEDKWQHRGFGRTLLEEAERIAREEYDRKKVVVISALGTKQYYAKFGYKHDGPYVSKYLD